MSGADSTADGRLRLLLIVNLPWDVRLGAVRVFAELAEQWRAAGHEVTTFSLWDAFGEINPSNAGFAIRQVLFARKAAEFVRQNAGKFDVVDAVVGSLAESKCRLRFAGLLVARSIGLSRLYQQVEKEVGHGWSIQPRGKLLGRMFYGFLRAWLNRISDKALRNADLVNLPNEEEAVYLRNRFKQLPPVLVQSYGITRAQRSALRAGAADVATRLAEKTISVVSMWAPRKGSWIWPEILRNIWRNIPDARFRFLGTMVDDESRVRAELPSEGVDRVYVLSRFPPERLPELISNCVVGAFPSYVEGFGLAVLEQLAAGIPTVAFDVPGPRTILGDRLPELLVPRGDVEKFVSVICRIATMDSASYARLSERCVDAGDRFLWENIADSTISCYRAAMVAASKR